LIPLSERRSGLLQTHSNRGALAILLLAAGFVSGFGAPGTSPSEAAAASAPRAVLEVAATQAASASSILVEYAAVSIDTLPLHDSDGAPSSEGAAPAALGPESGAWNSGASLTVVTKGKIARGHSLSRALQGQGISASTVHLIAQEMRPVYNFRHSQVGDRYRLGQDPEGNVLDFRYSVSAEKSFYLFWEGTRYVVREEHAELRAQLAKVAGIVETSLYEAIRSLGERSQLAGDFADIFAWDIDFSRSVRPGDDFQILYERLYRTDDDGEQLYVRPGRILAARYRGRNTDSAVVYFESEGGRSGYFRPDGSSIERAFLAAPLKFSRISSRYNPARAHPILKVVRPHRGIDYAASAGTPLWSVADGTVIYRGWAGGSGNLVKVRHANGYVSYYAHLSRFEKGLKVGQRVAQKTVIGYVGSTGLATGPHVCFRVQRDGKYVNPMDIASPPGESIAGDEWRRHCATPPKDGKRVEWRAKGPRYGDGPATPCRASRMKSGRVHRVPNPRRRRRSPP